MNKDLLVISKNSPAKKAARLIKLQAIYKEIKPEIDALKAELLEVMQVQDYYTLKTGSYTLSRAHKITPRVVDFKQLKASLKKAKIPVLTQEVFADQMNVVFKQMAEEKKLLPGLEVLETEYLSIRIKELK